MMAAELGQPIVQLKHLFANVARAVVTTQEKLDEASPPPSGSPPIGPPPPIPPAAFYSIPRVDVSLSFGLEEINRRRFLIPFFRGSSDRLQKHAHELTFSVVAVPDPPPSPRGVPDDEEDRGGTRFPVTLIQPHFFVPLEEQKILCARLAEAMEAGRWDFVYPERGEKPTQEEVNDEARKIRRDIAPENPERGMVVFELDTAPPSFLIVRVTGRSRQDGVFVFAPGQETEAIIYSFDGDDIKNIRYKALHEFALTVRHWLAGTPPRYSKFEVLGRPPKESPNGLGLLALSEFTGCFAEGYISGLRYVSAPRVSGRMTPAHVDLTDVRAELRYSVYYDNERLRFSFGTRRKLDGAPLSGGDRRDDDRRRGEENPKLEDEITLIESRTIIRASRTDAWPRVDVELVTPEFSLTGRARQLVVAAAAEIAASIAGRFDAGNPDLYLKFLVSDSYQRGVVILLSYEGEVPKQKFLVIWPGLYEERPRDFIFTCELKEGKIDVDSVSPVMSLKQKLEEAGGAEGVELDRDQYEPFHDFFHAVRMWLSRTDKERSENKT